MGTAANKIAEVPVDAKAEARARRADRRAEFAKHLTEQAEGDVTYPPDGYAVAFVDLATARVERCLSDLKLIGNLSASQYQTRTDPQLQEMVERMFSTLQEKLDGTRAQFTPTTPAEREGFRLI